MPQRNRSRKKRSAKKKAKLSKVARAKLHLDKMPKENTLPERITKRLLKHLEQDYIPQYPMDGYVYDFYLPLHNLLIEVHGDYFHANPLKFLVENWSYTQHKLHRRDKRKLKVAKKHGKRIIYVWESDLKNRVNKVLEDLRGSLEDKTFSSKHLLENIFPEYKKFYPQ